MQKIKQLFDKYDIFLIILFFAIAVSGRLFYVWFDSGDELWNFSNIYKMTAGFTIYQDMNVIITPLFFYLGELFLKVVGISYLSFKFYGVILYTIFFLLIYVLFRSLKTKKIVSFLYTLGLFMQYTNIIPNGANYNELALSFCLLGIIEKVKSTKYSNIIQGIVMFLIIMTKQNIGILYFVGLICYEIVSEHNGKEKWKNIFMQSSITGVLGILFLFSLQIQGNLIAFINYTMLGIQEFAQKNFGIEYITNIIMLGGIMLLLLYVIGIVKSKKGIEKIKSETRNRILILTSISMPLIWIAYPIFNVAHVIIGCTIPTIALFYVINILLQENYEKWKKVIITFVIILSIIVLGASGFYLYQYNQKLKVQQYPFANSQIYQGTIIQEEIQNAIREVTQYILEENEKGQEVVILSHRANIYMNILQRSNGKLDLPFLGNLGREGEEGLIHEIEKWKHTKVLLSTSEENLYQESKKVREYIKTNYQKVGEIAEFDIYEVN